MSGNGFLWSLLFVSEKGADIARVCRQDDKLLSLLIQEKKEVEKNPRFVHDFKTLADVLVQEVVKHELVQKFPSLNGKIHGEESNVFSVDGKDTVVEVQACEAETAALLNSLLDDEEASASLARVIHNTCSDNLSNTSLPECKLPQNIGVWIDPIDSTSEYIQGKDGDEAQLTKSGLPCVTVLIGVFNIDTGEPIVGVINQPFFKKESKSWSGRRVFGCAIDDLKITCPNFILSCKKVVAVSASEDDDIKKTLSDNGYQIFELAGAGYKLLSIIAGDVSSYILTKPTTFLWDVCAGHAILNSIGGGVISYKTLKPIKYKGGTGIKECCNTGGVIAYRNADIKDNIIKTLNLKPEAY